MHLHPILTANLTRLTPCLVMSVTLVPMGIANLMYLLKVYELQRRCSYPSMLVSRWIMELL